MKSLYDRSSKPSVHQGGGQSIPEGWVCRIMLRGSHIRLQKRTSEGTIKVSVPAHRPLKRETLAKLTKESGLSLEGFKEFL